ncbi:hypothetical protein LLG95_10300, partial [bacterium]|nr:hypothetical protein [bacterium]
IPVTSYTLHVPAGVKLGVAMNPTNDQWRPVKLAAAISLAQGESRDLGEFAVKASAIAPVQVVGPDGAPIEGAPMYNGWSRVHNTDAQGVAYFFVEPGTKGEFELRVQQNEKTVLSAKVPFDCPENVTDLPMLTITLTADQAALLSETLKLKPADQVTSGSLANPAAAQ